MKKEITHILVSTWLLILFGGFSTIKSQIINTKADSLEQLLYKVTDENKPQILNQLFKVYLSKYPDKAIQYALQSSKLSKKLQLHKEYIDAINQLGEGYYYTGKYSKSLEYLLELIENKIVYKDTTLLAQTKSRIGVIYFSWGIYDRALEYMFESLKLQEKQQNQEAIANTMNNIGTVYKEMNNIPKAYDYLSKSMNIYEKLNDKKKVAYSLNNIGTLYKMGEDYDNALRYFKMSAGLGEDIDDKMIIGNAYGNIGDTYLDLDAPKKALSYFNKSYDIFKTGINAYSLAYIYKSIGKTYMMLKRYKDADIYLDSSLQISLKSGMKDVIKDAFFYLTENNKKAGNYQKALNYQTQYTEYKDSLFDITINSKVAELQFMYEKEKREKEIAVLNQKNTTNKHEIVRQRMHLYIFAIVFIILVSILLIIIITSKIKQKANHELLKAYDELNRKNESLTASLDYAKRIQNTILPYSDRFRSLFYDSFIINKPKDVVSGDFYWAEKSGEDVYIAVIDCVGHGVPGAFMSFLGYAILDNVYKNTDIKNLSTAEIMSKINSEAKKVLKQENKIGLNMGMDVALCKINSISKVVQFSGANRPLYYIESGKLNVLKGNSISVGSAYSNDKQEFISHKLFLDEGDSLYLFTDGFIDQFGGKENKKFLSKRLRKIIIDNWDKDMADQEKALSKSFDEWKKNNEQLDDVMLIGIRI